LIGFEVTIRQNKVGSAAASAEGEREKIRNGVKFSSFAGQRDR